MARLLDRSGVDVLLVGDSLGMVVQGHETTVPVTVDQMVYHTEMVSRAAARALVVADMPFMTAHGPVSEGMRHAARLVQEGGAAAVKIEGPVLKLSRRLTGAGIPVMGHLGLTPQSVHQLGGFRPQARTDDAAERLLNDALELERAGIMSLVLESVPPAVADRVTAALAIPTIGIGAGSGCDGQVLDSHDLLGLGAAEAPPFVMPYAQLGEDVMAAAGRWVRDVRSGRSLETESRSETLPRF
jgi:3-methyl-2-oxobutanoate hydroxymethyltransferase